jgi:lysophospholipid acyltransferase (LPLAT)-like uncharacterized protein
MAIYRSTIFLNRFILTPLAYYLVRMLLLTVSIKSLNEDILINHLENGGKAIIALWHQRFFPLIGYAKKFRIYEPSAIISLSNDGDLMTQVAVRLGVRPIRGSSSRGGAGALFALVRDLAQHPLSVHSVDGPRGPKGIVKTGLIKVAQLSQAAIFPLYITVDHAWILNSWDRFLIPKPFSHVLIHWDHPVPVPRKMDKKTFEDIRLEVEERMTRGHGDGDQSLGWKHPL